MDDLDDVRVEQMVYYRARAGEYERWWFREGRYDRGFDATRRWFDEAEEVRSVFRALAVDHAEVIELACGSGLWTEHLATRARRVVAIDASSEMVEECRRRLGPLVERVEFRLADLFVWEPDRAYDAVVFCFWISHIPDGELDSFLARVAQALHPGGEVFFLDGRPEPTSTASNHVLPSPGAQVMVRRLDDGREFRVIKNYWSAGELQHRFASAGLTVEVSETATYFQYGIGTKES